MKRRLPLVLVLSLFLTCSSSDEAAVIRDIIQAGADQAETHDIRALTAHLTPDFKAQPGGYGPKTIRGVLLNAFHHYKTFKIYYPRPLVDLDASKETARATVYFVILRKDYVLPGLRALYDDPKGWIAAVGQKADLYELELAFTKKGGSWKVQKARMNPLKGMSP